MQINVPLNINDLEKMSIRGLIIMDIHLGILCREIENYDYDMSFLKENKELVHDELQKKMKAENRKELKKTEAQIEALKPDSDKLNDLKLKVNLLKNKLGIEEKK